MLEAAGTEARWVRGVHRVAGDVVLAGPVTTVSVPPADNLELHEAIAACAGGEVLAVAAGGETGVALMGEIVVTAAVVRGVAGVVTDGAVRDVAALALLGLPIFAGGISPVGPRKERHGRVGEPVELGAVRVDPGDWLVGDEDGVVVFPGERLEAVLEAASARHLREEQVLDAVRAGASTLDALGVRLP